ncbi:hypothetical protein [Agarivorans gilvus]|uniref:Uncharacterized protein n=1 Tax=Agarivorans gilvus TaxID=680279 RepID=A0ABQ1I0Y0_9ALTE|nr:hypothetical protein [Agarivorans gilvus]GGB06023.1 hypothetical protein GCM10007414_19170 [Agarivorans gilvus]
MNSDLDRLVKQEAPWKDNLVKTSQAFDDTDNTLVIVIAGEQRQQV